LIYKLRKIIIHSTLHSSLN